RQPRQLWIMKADGTAQHRLVDDPDHENTAGAYSPDGEQIVFSRCDLRGSCGLYEVRIHGTRFIPITRNQPGVAGSSPVYSTDGLTIAFERHSGSRSALFLADRNGSNIRALTKLPRAYGLRLFAHMNMDR